MRAAELMVREASSRYEAGEQVGAEANMAKLLAADASWEAGNVCLQTHGGFGFAEEYHVERKLRETRLYQVAPISTNLILSFLAEHVLDLPRSYMRRAAIVNPVRTPVGAFGGALRPVPVETLGGIVAKETLKRSGLDPKLVEDVVFAQSYANSETPCVGRWIALDAGFPIEVPGLQTDRRCGGGLQALVTAAMMVQTGACDIVLAGGVESMSNIEYYTTDMRWGKRSGTTQFYDRLDRGRERSQPVHRFGYISGMIETAENLAKDYNITREDADVFAAESHRRAVAAWDEGRFADEVVPVPVPQRKGDPVLVARDEGIRPESTPETLAKLKAIMKEGTVTAGNAAQQNDAAAACLVVADDKLASLASRHHISPAGPQLAATRRAWGWGQCRRFGR